MRRAERLQKVSRVEGLAGRDNASLLGQPIDHTLCRFHYDWSADRIDVSPARHCPALLVSSSCDHVYKEDLGRAPALVCRRRRRHVGIGDVRYWLEIHVRANLRRLQMPWYDDGFGKGETYDILQSERRWKIPHARWSWITALQSIVRKDETPDQDYARPSTEFPASASNYRARLRCRFRPRQSSPP